jgi:hypothetical protein
LPDDLKGLTFRLDADAGQGLSGARGATIPAAARALFALNGAATEGIDPCYPILGREKARLLNIAPAS